MAEALMVANGAWCLSLGAQTPTSDIVGAAAGTTIDIVALSFSSSYPWRKARNALVELRAALPGNIEVWVGGDALIGRERMIPGVAVLEALSHIGSALSEWRMLRRDANPTGEAT